MELRRALGFSDNCNALMLDVLRGEPAAVTREFQTLSKYNTILKLLAHCASAEERWVEQGIFEGVVAVRYEDRAATDLEGVFADWAAFRARTWAAMDTDLSEVVPYELPHWNFSTKMIKEEMLYHVVNHETFHRGQISMALQQMKVDPPNFDYPFMQVVPPVG